MDASAWIDLVIARSGELRRAGITAIGFEGCTTQLLPDTTPPAADDKSAAPVVEEAYPDPLRDPASFPGGFVPGYTIQRLGDD